MLKVESDGAILWVTLDRPEVRNAFNRDLIDALLETFSGPAQEARAVVVTGSGQDFSAGGDLNWMREAATYTEDQNYEDALCLATLYGTIATCPSAVLCKVHGAAMGGGCGLVAAADIAVASESAKFAFSEVRLGLVPATISPFVLRKIGYGHSRALFVTGEVFDAHRAYLIGLVHAVAPPEDLPRTLEAKVDAVLSAGPQAVARCKQLTNEPPMGAEESARLLAQVRATEEAQEGLAAFLEKRSASFGLRS